MKNKITTKIICSILLLTQAFTAPSSFASSPPPPGAELAALKDQAISNYHDGKYEEAAQLYRQILAKDPKNIPIMRDLMWALWESENYEDSQSVAHKILQINPDDVEARDMAKKAPVAILKARAVKSYRAGKFDDAAQAYKELLEGSPRNPSYMKDLYWSNWQAGRMDKVVEIATQLTDYYPKDIEGWNLLGRAYVALNKQEDAYRAFQKSLAINPHQNDTRRVLGRLLVDLRDFDSAIETLGELEQNNPNNPTIYPQLGKALFFKGRYAESAKHWAKAVELFPENDNYRMHEARALYYNGQTALALSKMKKIASRPGLMQGFALDFIVDDEIANQNKPAAEKLLEDYLKDPVLIQDEIRLTKLATIYLDDNKYPECIRTVDRLLKLDPTNQPMMLMKADTMYDHGATRQAAAIYKQVRRLNPYSIRAFDGLSNAELANGSPLAALKASESALALDPTDPYMIILKAHYTTSAGNEKEGRDIMKRWLADNPKEETLPVLLYHGLTPFKRDPMLAYKVHLTVAQFDDHMRALKSAGYTPVTTEQILAWYKKNKPLPKKPILISFDDGRLDSFRWADPILQKYNLKATMFIPLANIEGNLPPAYVSWSQIIQFQNSGRWEFQSHGDVGHTRIVIDPAGRMGLFLVNRQWLDKDGRYETLAEWKRRVLADHESCKRKISERLGVTPVSFAYPEGTYGQIDIVNSPESAPVNLAAAAKAYQIAYHQDRFGINVHSRDPMFLTRIEPLQTWTGEDLLHHLQDQTPFVLMYRRLLWDAAWVGRPDLATTYLKSLKKAGASQVVLLGEEGRIRATRGDFLGAKKSVDQARSIGKDQDIDKLDDSIKNEARPYWRPAYSYSEDNKRRRAWIFDQSFVPVPVAPYRVSIDYRYGEYKDRIAPNVYQNGAGVTVQHRISQTNLLSANGMWHWFNRDIVQTYTAMGDIDSRWNDNVETELSGGRALYDTARSLNHRITENYLHGFVSLRQDEDGPWSVSAKAEGSNLSDENKRYGLQAGIVYLLGWNFRAVYRYTFDNMKHLSEDYYSPQQLHQNQLGLGYEMNSGWIRPSLMYLPGIGHERMTGNQFVQDAELAVNFHFNDRTSLTPFYGYIKTPTYWRNTFNIELQHRF